MSACEQGCRDIKGEVLLFSNGIPIFVSVYFDCHIFGFRVFPEGLEFSGILLILRPVYSIMLSTNGCELLG